MKLNRRQVVVSKNRYNGGSANVRARREARVKLKNEYLQMLTFPELFYFTGHPQFSQYFILIYFFNPYTLTF